MASYYIYHYQLRGEKEYNKARSAKKRMNDVNKIKCGLIDLVHNNI